MKLSIVIPVLNEAESLGGTLEALAGQSAEIIVVDGGSEDDTVKIARQYASPVMTAPRGRGPQQDAGARQSHGRVLLFLHADTRLPGGYERLIDEALARPGVVFGAFYLKIHPSSPALNLIASMANLRSRFFQMPYGDQALFVQKDAYLRVGGFPDWPVMEDVDLVRRLNRVGRFQLAGGSVVTSGRRWRREKALFTTLRNWSLMIRYYVGHCPYTLARHYPDAR